MYIQSFECGSWELRYLLRMLNIFNLSFDIMKRNKIETLVQATMKIYYLMLFLFLPASGICVIGKTTGETTESI